MEIKIIRKRIKNFRISVKRTGEVIFSVPYFATEEKITEILNAKRGWIEKKVREINAQKEAKANLGGFLYLGKVLPETDEIFSGTDVSNPKKLAAFYKKKATETGTLLVEKYSEIMGAKANSVSFYSPKSRWGQCDAKGNVKLHISLIKAPLPVFEYVVVHELSHLFVMAHDKSFYAVLKRYRPDYKECEKWLKRNGEIIR